MIKLFLIKYTGIRHRGNAHSHSNVNQRFINEIGFAPNKTLDQPDRDKLIDFIHNIVVGENDDVILHLIAHGTPEGIAHELANDPEVGDRRTLISWDQLCALCNFLRTKCKSVHLNLGTVHKTDKLTPL